MQKRYNQLKTLNHRTQNHQKSEIKEFTSASGGKLKSQGTVDITIPQLKANK